jgi:Subtilase family
MVTAFSILASGCSDTEDRGRSSRSFVRLEDRSSVFFERDESGEPRDGFLHVSRSGSTSSPNSVVRNRAWVVDSSEPPPATHLRPGHRLVHAERIGAEAAPTLLSPSEEVSFTAALDGDDFDWRVLGRLRANTEERTAVLASRQEAISSLLRPVVSRLRELGVQTYQVHPLTPSIDGVAPMATVRLLSNMTGLHVQVNARRLRGHNNQFGGQNARAGMRVSSFHSNGITGNSFGRMGGALRFGIVELEGAPTQNNWPNFSHVGYLEYAGYFPPTINTRWVAVRDYVSVPSNLYPGGPTTWPTGHEGKHGNNVARVLAGSIESGIDSSQTNQIDRIQRSGVAGSGSLYYYRINASGSGLSLALEQAIIDGIDVLNMSFGVPCIEGGPPSSSPSANTGCSIFCDNFGARAGLQNAADAGILLVAGVGNGGTGIQGTVCNAGFPATNTNVLSAGWLDTSTTPSSPSSVSEYDSSILTSESGRGGIDVVVSGAGSSPIQNAFGVVSLSAPGAWSFPYGMGTTGYAYSELPFSGTSFSSPAVAASAGLLRAAFNWIGWSLNDSRVLMTNMLLMGDGYQATWGGGQWPLGMDRRSGAGRVHLQFPFYGSMVAPLGWGWHTADLQNGQDLWVEVGGPGVEESGVTHWKCAMTWRETASVTSQPVADIVLEVWDFCAPGGPIVVRQDWSYDIHKRMELNSSEITNRCLRYRVRALSIPSGQTRRVYVADYYHSGNPADH